MQTAELTDKIDKNIPIPAFNLSKKRGRPPKVKNVSPEISIILYSLQIKFDKEKNQMIIEMAAAREN